MNTIRKMTCIVCPMGCQLEAEIAENGTVVSVTGNTCRRGAEYARNELTDPRRTLTSTVRVLGSGTDALLPVKTDAGIPKAKIAEAMALLHTITVRPPLKRGDVIYQGFIEENINLVAGKSIR